MTGPVHAPPGRFEDLVAEAASLAFRYGQEPEDRTRILRQMAAVLVQLRSGCTTDDGRTDWAGRSGAYRAAVGDIYRQSRLSEDERETMQAALRYHVGNRVREVAPEAELEDLGLRKERPVDRVKLTRDRLAALARTGAAMGDGDGAAADPVRLAIAARVMMERIAADPEAIEALTPKRRADLAAAVDTVGQLSARLADYTDTL